jgi:hypothetical protein
MRAGRLVRLGLTLTLIIVPSAPPTAEAAGPPVVVSADQGVDSTLLRRVRDVVSARRAIRDDLALPPPDAVSADQVAMTERAAGIRLALGRARRAESEASWDACVREAADALPAAVEVLAKVNDLLLLRDLHLQIGACLTLAGSPANARPHFVSAALLDESEPTIGVHREQAEKLQAEARLEVLARAHGPVRIETVPPGAEVWIDGRKATGVTPLTVDARLGDHYITARRFRFEPHTERSVLQPSGTARVVLDPAGRGTLREQLASLAAGALTPPSTDELRLARALWSRAEQVVALTPVGAKRCRLQVLDAATGEVLKSAPISHNEEDDSLRRAVCNALGETCETKPRGIPWYVWPIGGLAIAGGVVSAVLIANANRDYRFVACPAGMMCH